MGNVLSPEEEARWEEECKKILFPFEINNAEFAEFGGSWKGLYDFIKQEDAQILLMATFLKAELDSRVEKVQVIQQLQGVPEPHHPTNNSDMYHPSIIARDQAIVEALQTRVGRAMLLEFKYVGLNQIDQALELGRQVLFAMQRRDFEFIRKNAKCSIPLDAGLIKEYVELSQLFNHMNGEGIMKQQIEPVLDELPTRYHMPTKARFNRSKSRGFSSILVELPWFSTPGEMWVNLDAPVSGGPPGFSGRVPVLHFVWKTGVKGPAPIPEDLRNPASQGHWLLTSFQMAPAVRKIKTTTLGSRGKNAANSNPNSASGSGTTTPQQAKSRGHSRRGSKDGNDKTSPGPGVSQGSTTSPPSTGNAAKRPGNSGTSGPPPGVGLLPIPEASSGAYVPPARRRGNSQHENQQTGGGKSPRGRPTTPRSAAPPPAANMPAAGPPKYNYFFLDNNVLVALARGDQGTLEWAAQHEGRLYFTEIAKEEFMTMGRTKLPPQAQFIDSRVPYEAQERAIQRIVAALSLTGPTAEKLKPDLRYLVQCSWVCWDERLGMPHDAQVAFITFNMKFWRRVLQDPENLNMIEYFLNDEGLEHLIDVVSGIDHIPNHGRSPASSTSSTVPSVDVSLVMDSHNSHSIAPIAGDEMRAMGAQNPEEPRAGLATADLADATFNSK